MTVKDTNLMIAGMTPVLTDGNWVYCSEPDDSRVAAVAANAFATVREVEGITLILPEHIADRHGYDTRMPMRRITLNVFSDLEGVGLTAAVARALTHADIPCNVIAGFHHDHVFVPQSDAKKALAALLSAQQAAANTQQKPDRPS